VRGLIFRGQRWLASEAAMKLYLGSSCHLAETTHRRAEELRAMGHDVVSRWTERPILVHLTEQDMKDIAWADYKELLSAGTVVIDCSVPSSSGGLATEIGLALAARKTLYIVAPDKNVFCRLATKLFPDWDSFMTFLQHGEPVRVLKTQDTPEPPFSNSHADVAVASRALTRTSHPRRPRASTSPKKALAA
jgi:hypothetical protein